MFWDPFRLWFFIISWPRFLKNGISAFNKRKGMIGIRWLWSSAFLSQLCSAPQAGVKWRSNRHGWWWMTWVEIDSVRNFVRWFFMCGECTWSFGNINVLFLVSMMSNNSTRVSFPRPIDRKIERSWKQCKTLSSVINLWSFEVLKNGTINKTFFTFTMSLILFLVEDGMKRI